MGILKNGKWFAPKKKVVVVDIDALQKENGLKKKASPGDQLKTLRRLAKYVAKEKINMTAVLVGKPLRKAAHAKEFDGIMVYFAKNVKKAQKILKREYRRNKKANTLITSRSKLEKKVHKAGGNSIRCATFLKVLSKDGSFERGKSRPNDKKNRKTKSPKKKPAQKAQKGNPKKSNSNKKKGGSNSPGKKNNSQNKSNKKSNKEREQEEIAEMIDLI